MDCIPEWKDLNILWALFPPFAERALGAHAGLIVYIMRAVLKWVVICKKIYLTIYGRYIKITHIIRMPAAGRGVSVGFVSVGR